MIDASSVSNKIRYIIFVYRKQKHHWNENEKLHIRIRDPLYKSKGKESRKSHQGITNKTKPQKKPSPK